MKAQAVDKKFFKFVLPSMFTMFLSGLYTIVDGFFVGHAVGDVGLAGIGLVWPITAVLIALGMGIGVGGSVLMSTARGAGCDENANAARANTLMLLVAASALLTLFLVFMNPVLVYALGARGEVYDAAMAYIRIISIGGSMQILASGLIPMIRNSHKTIQAMVIMSTGLVCNIILDACLTMVVPMGLAGAALATIIAQSLTVAGSLICLFRDREHPVRRRHFRLQKRMMVKMLRIGVSPFGLSLMPSVICRFHQQHPQVKVRIMEGQLLAMINELRQGELDFTINTYYPGPYDHEFSFEKLFEKPFAVFARAGHPAAQATSLGELMDHHWTMPTPRGSYFKQLQERFEQLGREPKVGIVCETFSSCISLVVKSDFLSILPVELGNDPLMADKLVMIPIREVLPTATYYLIQRRDTRQTPLTASLITLFRRQSRQLFP